VFRGKGGQRGTLEGFLTGQTVNFREQIGVYVLYNENYRAIYVWWRRSVRTAVPAPAPASNSLAPWADRCRPPSNGSWMQTAP